MSFCGNENKAWLLISPSTSKYQLLFCWHCSCYLYSLPRVLRRVNVPYSKIRFKPTQTDQPSIIPFIFLQENTISRSFGFCHWGRLWCTVAPPSFDALALQYSLSLIGGVLCVIVFSAYPSSCLFCRKFIHAYFDHFHFLVHTLSWFRVCSSQAILRRRSCIKRILRHCVLRPVLHRVVSGAKLLRWESQTTLFEGCCTKTTILCSNIQHFHRKFSWIDAVIWPLKCTISVAVLWRSLYDLHRSRCNASRKSMHPRKGKHALLDCTNHWCSSLEHS